MVAGECLIGFFLRYKLTQGGDRCKRSAILVERHGRGVHVFAQYFIRLRPKVAEEAATVANEELRLIG